MNGFDLIIVPDAEDPEAAEVLVDGTIGGRECRFLLDTGAARSSVNYDEYTATLESAAQSHSSGVFARNSYDLITVPSIALGPIARQDFTIVRAAESRSDGRNLIGMDLLKDFCCHFLFDENRVEVGEQESGDWRELFLDKAFHPYVELQFGAATANAVWDTGAGLTVVDMGFIDRHTDLFQEAGQSIGTDSTGTQMDTPMYRMAAHMIGGHRFPAITVAGVDLSGVNATIETPMDLILGYNAMKHANWLFDFPRKKWAISKML